jgi:hypothetical protein
MIVKLIERIEILDGRNDGARRAFSQLVLETLNRFLTSFRCDLHRPVGTIAHPAPQTKPARYLAHMPAKSYALDAASHEDMQSHLCASGPACIAVPTM